MQKPYCLLFLLCTAIILNGCKKQTDSFTSSPLTNYYPLQPGKYITYDLDSTIFINFGQRDTVIKYQAQDVVDEKITDNLGRPAYRVIRYIRKNASQSWSPNNTFMVVPTDNTIEVVEDNLRFQKLKLPITNGFSWKGNSFVDTYSLNSDIKYLDDWDYTYDSVNVPLSIGTYNFDSTIKVFQRDEFLGQNPGDPGTQYAEKNYGVEKYAKSVGLIYKEFIHWEYQGSQPGKPAYYLGYGIKLSIIDHN
ncbi:MAG: hypothetical protein ABJA57_11145 [Ginsengibacter sp.]